MDWKTIRGSIKIKPTKKKNETLVYRFIKEKIQAEKCMFHKLNYSIFSNLYKKYRRGKNRCKYCGLKLEDEK